MKVTEASAIDLPHAGGDDYGQLYRSLQLRLIDLVAYKTAFGEDWDWLQFESFAFKSRMLIEELCLFLRAAFFERSKLTKKQITSYGPTNIIGSLRQQVSSMRFITAVKFSVIDCPEDEIQINFEYHDFLFFSVEELEGLCGKLGNYIHPTSKHRSDTLAISILKECFDFYQRYERIFQRHALERQCNQIDGPPTDLDHLLFVVGYTDDGKNWLLRRNPDGWTIRKSAE